MCMCIFYIINCKIRVTNKRGKKALLTDENLYTFLYLWILLDRSLGRSNHKIVVTHGMRFAV